MVTPTARSSRTNGSRSSSTLAVPPAPTRRAVSANISARRSVRNGPNNVRSPSASTSTAYAVAMIASPFRSGGSLPDRPDRIVDEPSLSARRVILTDMSEPLDYGTALDDLAPDEALDVIVGSAIAEVLEPAAIVAAFPWQCVACRHHELWHVPGGGSCTRADCSPPCRGFEPTPTPRGSS